MRWTMALALTMACVEEDLWLQEVGEGAIYLMDEAADQIPDRVRIRDIGEARMFPDGRPLALDGPAGRWAIGTELVVVDPGPEPRVLYEDASIQMLLYLSRNDLDDVLWVETFATVGPEPTEAGVLLPPGVSVDTFDEVDGGFYVSAENEAVTVEVWVPAEAVDQWWTLPFPKTRTGGADLTLPGQTEILDRPDGDAFAWIRSVDAVNPPDVPWVPAQRTGRQEGDYVEVVVDADGWEVVGWIRDIDPGFGGWGRGAGWFGCHHGVRATHVVPKGTLLYAAPGGATVARLLEDYPASGPAEDPFEITHSTPWGLAHFWVEPDDVVPVSSLADGS